MILFAYICRLDSKPQTSEQKIYEKIKNPGRGGFYSSPSVEILEISTSQSVCALSYNKPYNYNDAGKTGFVWYDQDNDDIDF